LQELFSTRQVEHRPVTRSQTFEQHSLSKVQETVSDLQLAQVVETESQ